MSPRVGSHATDAFSSRVIFPILTDQVDDDAHHSRYIPSNYLFDHDTISISSTISANPNVPGSFQLWLSFGFTLESASSWRTGNPSFSNSSCGDNLNMKVIQQPNNGEQNRMAKMKGSTMDILPRGYNGVISVFCDSHRLLGITHTLIVLLPVLMQPVHPNSTVVNEAFTQTVFEAAGL